MGAMKTNEIKRYYYKLINDEFRKLQLDENLRNKSVFDLIDYCELLYENLANSVVGDEESLKYYIKGYLIFNYFINSFIMLHFDGFDQFISTNEYDFIIYLNVFAFYNTDDMIDTTAYRFPLTELRKLILEYLDDKSLLKFDVNELYEWLYEYIEYLKRKDQFLGSDEEFDGEQSKQRNGYEDDFDGDKLYQEYLSESQTSQDLTSNIQHLSVDDAKSINSKISNGSSDYIEDFQQRFPSLKYNENSRSNISVDSSHKMTDPLTHLPPPPKAEPPIIEKEKKTYQAIRPPIPTNLPPGLPLANKNSKPTSKSHDDLLSTPYPVKPEYLNDVKETPYPLKRDVSTDDLYFNDSKSKPPPLVSSSTEPVISSQARNGHSSFTNNYNIGSRPIPPIPTSNPPVTPQQYQYHTNQPQMSGPPHLVPVSQMSIPFPMAAPVQNHLSYSSPGPLMPVPAPPSMDPNGYPYNPPVGYQNFGPQQYQYQAPQQYAPYNQPPPSNGKSKRMQEYSICGLKNFGSSCYINSTIQLLFGIGELKLLFTNLEYNKFIMDPKFIAAKKSQASNSKDSVLLSEAVSGLLKSFNLHGGASIAPTKFIRISSLLKPDLNIPYEQQDAQEFLLFVLDRLHEELSNKSVPGSAASDLSLPVFENYIKIWGINILPDELEGYFKWYKSLIEYEGNSPIHDLFEGHLQNKLICDKCGYLSVNYSPFTILSLPIPSSRGRNGNVDLSECLRYYTQDEILRGENAWKCPKCFKQLDDKSSLDNHPVFTKKPGIFKLSRRSKSPSKESKSKEKHLEKEKATALSVKKLNFIKLPKILFIHLSRFSMHNLTDKLDTNIIYPSHLKFNNYSKSSPNGGQITYKLMGIINHYGNLKSGHYTSLVNKSGKKQYWCYFDDESVKLNINHGEYHSKLQSRDVYVLCYERV